MLRTVALLSDGLLVLANEVGRDSSAVLDAVAVLPCPGTDSHGVYRARLAARAGGSAAGRPAQLAGVGDIGSQGGAEFFVVLSAEVDFVFRAVQGEADGAVGLAAVDVVDEQGLDLLGHGMLRFPGVADYK